MTTVYTFRWGYKKSGVGTAPANAPTVKLVTSADVVLGSGLSPTALANLPGVYVYSYTGADGLDPIGLISTTDTTMDAQDIWDYTPSILREIKAKTDNLPTDPADESAIEAAITAATSPLATQTSVNAIPITPLLAANYTEPDNVSIALIKAKTDTLPISASVAISRLEAEKVATGTLVITAGHTLRQAVDSTSTQDLASATKLWLAVKSKKSKSDSISMIFLEQIDGLTVVNREPYTETAHGSLTVTGVPGAWKVAIFLDKVATLKLLGSSGNYVAEIKALVGVTSDAIPAWDGPSEIIDGIVLAVE